MNQLLALRKAFASERRALRLKSIWIEVWNPYTGMIWTTMISIKDLQTKTTIPRKTFRYCPSQ